MWVRKKTQYGGDVVIFIPKKIIKNKKLNYPQKNVGLAHGFKTMCNPWFRRALHITHGFIVDGLGGLCTWFAS